MKKKEFTSNLVFSLFLFFIFSSVISSAIEIGGGIGVSITIGNSSTSENSSGKTDGGDNWKGSSKSYSKSDDEEIVVKIENSNSENSEKIKENKSDEIIQINPKTECCKYSGNPGLWILLIINILLWGIFLLLLIKSYKSVIKK